MSSIYTIDNAGYPQDFLNSIKVPVTEEIQRTCTLSGTLRSQLKPGNDFTFTLDQAIVTAERHMFILDPASKVINLNPSKLVSDWVNLLRWEVGAFWQVIRGSPDQITTKAQFTHEHPKRSGEMLAEGISLLFLEDRMKYPPQCFWFYKGAKARPDFIFDSTFRGMGGMWNGSQFGVEARCRSSQANLHGVDEDDLQAKKAANPNLSCVLGVYFFHGQGPHASNSAPMTRIHLADPEGQGRSMHDYERAWVIINHYLGVVSRIGMWEHRDHLSQCLHDAASGLYPKRHLSPQDPKAIRRVVHGPLGWPRDKKNFVGRHFNTLLEMACERPADQHEYRLIRQRVQAALDSGSFGYHVFRGLRKDVVAFLADAKWRELEQYRDKDTGIHDHGVTITADGVLVQRMLVTDRTTQEAQDVVDQLRAKEYRIND